MQTVGKVLAVALLVGTFVGLVVSKSIHRVPENVTQSPGTCEDKNDDGYCDEYTDTKCTKNINGKCHINPESKTVQWKMIAI